ncbi:MAG: hypothetical protein ACI38A_00495 [Candidatus Ornithomonoglobus sp.]
MKCGCCGFSYRRYIRNYSPNTPPKIWWTCSKRSAYGTGRCESEYMRVNEDWLIDSLNKVFNLLIEDKDSFFNMVETKCNSVIKEYVRNTSQFTIEDVEEELSELKEQRENLKTLAVKGLITMEEAEYDMRPINAQIEQLNFKLNEADKTKEITQKVKQNIKTFFDTFSTFHLTEELSNAELKKVIKEIRVVSRDEIYVYFNISEDIEGLNFPINISEIFEIDNRKKGEHKTNTDYEHAP